MCPRCINSSSELLLLLLFVSLFILEIWSTKLSKPFKINELAMPLNALYLGQDLISPPGLPYQVSVHLWHPARFENACQLTRGVLGGTHLHIQQENVSSIDSRNERLNLWQKFSLYTLQFAFSFLILLWSNYPEYIH